MTGVFVHILIGLITGLLFVGPILSFVLSLAGQRVGPRTAWGLAAVAALVFGGAQTPVSLPGHTSDLVALAHGALCVAVGAVPNTWFQRAGIVALMVILAVPGLFVVLGTATPAYERTVDVGCGQRVRFEPWGWVASGGDAAVLLWQPTWVPVEVEQARQQFDFDQYPDFPDSTRFGASPRSECGVEVTYQGRSVWRAR